MKLLGFGVTALYILLFSPAWAEPRTDLATAESTTVSVRNTPQGLVSKIPEDVVFNTETLFRTDEELPAYHRGNGDNWCITWTPDNKQITSMDDGAWISEGGRSFHHMTYRIDGEADSFTRSKVTGYPEFLFGNEDQPGWYGYGVVSIEDTIYSMVTRAPGNTFGSPFQGIKMLKSSDNGANWYQVNREGETKLVTPTDYAARNSTAVEDMFFWQEDGTYDHSRTWYPFSWVSFVQNGQAGSASPDGYVYIYSPEGHQANHLLLARAKKEEFEVRDNWEYFQRWEGDTPVWTSDMRQRGDLMVFPSESSTGEDFSWYSWLPSVVWNEGLGLYIMVNGGVYAHNYNWNWIDVSGSLGFWYSENPYGPWTQFYYTDHFNPDSAANRIYQPKLSPKWISEDGEEMVLIWSDAQENAQGQSHTINYRWNQMKIDLQVSSRSVLPLPNNTWKLISLPAEPLGDSTVVSVFGDDLPTAGYGSEWVMFSLDDSGQYIKLGLNSVLTTGKGYWMIQKTGATVALDLTPQQSVSAVQSAACSSDNGCYEVPLVSNGGIHWNSIGFPVESELSFSPVTSRAKTNNGVCVNGCSLNVAEQADYVHNQMWRYSGSSYELIESGDNLNPWDGLWLPALSNSAGQQPKLLLPVN